MAARVQLLVAVTGSSAFILGNNTLMLLLLLKQGPELASSSLGQAWTSFDVTSRARVCSSAEINGAVSLSHPFIRLIHHGEDSPLID